MSIRSSDRRFNKIPLILALSAPFIALTVLAVGWVGYLSFRNGQKAVNDVAYQLRNDITQRIYDHLHTFLDTPHHINLVNAGTLQQGLIDANDPAALERHFWRQVRMFKSISSIYFGNTQGGLVNSGREGAADSQYVIVTDGFTSGPFKKYATDRLGNRTDLLVTVPDFDARTRQWYAGAVAKGKAVWSPVYILFTGHDMAIAASRPVYNDEQKLLGVVSSDIFLSHISLFLQNLSIGETGRAFIIERSGLQIASSAAEKPFTEPGGAEPQRRLHASESAIPMIRYAAEALNERPGGYHNITDAQHIEFEINGQLQVLQALPVTDEYGLDWLIVVIIPQADFMNQIKANNRVTALFIVLTLVIAIIISIFTARMITLPIGQLQDSSRILAKEKWTQAIRDDSRLGEISALTRSFNQMAGQLQQMLDDLNHEIAERKHAERELLASEEKYRIMVENQTDLIVKFDIEGQLLFVSPSYCKTFEKPREELIGTSFMPLIHEDDRKHVVKAIENVYKPPYTAYVEERVMTKDGWCWQSWMNTGVLDDEGQVAYIIAVGRDITVRKRIEKTLIESEAKYRELFDNMSSGVAVYEVKDNGKDFIFTDFNKAGERMDGDKREDLIGRSIFDMKPGVEEFGLIDVFQKVWNTGKPAFHPITLYQDEKLTGWYENFVYKLPSGEIVAVFDNITGRKQTEEALAEKHKEMESYLYATSHDLRSPLVNIQGFGQRLQKQTGAIKKMLSEYPPEPEIKQKIEKITDQSIPNSLDFILTNVSKMDTLINSLLKISRTVQVKMAIQKINMNNMMENIIGTFHFQIEEAGADFVVENLPDCYGDANLLNRLFSNIIDNSLKYRDKNRQLIVTIAALTQYNKVIYSIQDTGVGIARRHLKKIWDVFYRVDSQIPETGEGIGLSIVKKIADKHKGIIRVESEENRGSVFYIELPENEFSVSFIRKNRNKWFNNV